MATFNVIDVSPIRREDNAEEVAPGVTFDLSNSIVHNATFNDL